MSRYSIPPGISEEHFIRLLASTAANRNIIREKVLASHLDRDIENDVIERQNAVVTELMKKKVGLGNSSTRLPDKLGRLIGSIASGNKSEDLRNRAMVELDKALANNDIDKSRHRKLYNKYLR